MAGTKSVLMTGSNGWQCSTYLMLSNQEELLPHKSPSPTRDSRDTDINHEIRSVSFSIIEKVAVHGAPYGERCIS